MKELHEQVCVKTNTWVDKEIAPLITALSQIDGLETFESCQDWFPGEASVLFHYGTKPTNWVSLGELCSKISNEIQKTEIEFVTVSVEWQGNNDQPWGRLVVKPENIKVVSEVIARLGVTIGSG